MGERRLGDGVGDAAPGRGQPGDRGHIDDPPALLALHDRRHSLDAEEGGGSIDPEDAFPQLQRHPVQILERHQLVVGGVVDEDVDPAELGQDPLDHLLERGRVGDIGLKGRAARPQGRPFGDQPLGLLLRRLVNPGDMHPLGGQRPADPLPEAPRGSGDDGDGSL